MGLDKDRGGSFDDRRQALRGWLLPALVALVALAAEAGGETARLALRYGRDAVQDGQLWRLFTAHVVHLGWRHLLMNLFALALVWLLVGRHLQSRQWLVVILIAVAGIDAGFWWLEPGLQWYVGLSGVLHGLLAAGLLAGWPHARSDSLILGGVLLLKLGYEQLLGSLPGSEATAGGAVVVDAHLYGVLAGVAGFALVRLNGRAGRAVSI